MNRMDLITFQNFMGSFQLSVVAKRLLFWLLWKVKQFLSCLKVSQSALDLIFVAVAQARFLFRKRSDNSGMNHGLSLPLASEGSMLFNKRGKCSLYIVTVYIVQFAPSQNHTSHDGIPVHQMPSYYIWGLVLRAFVFLTFFSQWSIKLLAKVPAIEYLYRVLVKKKSISEDLSGNFRLGCVGLSLSCVRLSETQISIRWRFRSPMEMISL